MEHTEFSWKNTDGLTLYAQEWKPDEPRAVVALVHGLGEHSGRYSFVAQCLNQAGFSLMAVDLPGHGQSEGQRGYTSYDEMMDETDRLLQEVRSRYPEQPCFLYGHSMGGGLVLYYALKRQPNISGIIATSPILTPGTPVPAWKEALAKTLHRLYPKFTMANAINRENLSRDPAVVKAYGADPLVHDRVTVRLGNDLLYRGDWIIANAEKFPLPLLLMQGTDDCIVSPQAVKKLVQVLPPAKVTYHEWEGCVHELHNEPEKEKVLQCMVDWLNDQI